MSIVFSSDELINIAIGIERRGISFYDVMAKSTENAMAREVFQRLVEMERQHIETFQAMLAGGEELPPTDTATEEYADYLQTLVDSAVFSDDALTSEMATQADSDIKALELAISAEKDSILFYYEMRDLMPRTTLPAVNQIIAEEKAHLRILSGIKKKLTAGD